MIKDTALLYKDHYLEITKEKSKHASRETDNNIIWQLKIIK